MEYVAPVNGDANDPTRPYQDGDPTLGQTGSIPSARFFNLMLAEGRNLVEGAGLTLDAQDDAQWLAAVVKLIQESAIAQPGDVKFTAMSTPPDGWLRANGAAVGRSAYPELFSAIGTTYGEGDGATTFNLPDLRGEFIRGWDDGRGADAGRALGSGQLDALQNLTGVMKTTLNISNSFDSDDYSGVFSASNAAITDSDIRAGGGGSDSYYTLEFNASNVARTADETRPRNVAMLACIKY